MLTQNPAALTLLLTDDLYRIKEKNLPIPVPVAEPEKPFTDEPLKEKLFSGSMENGCLILLDETGTARLSAASEDVLTKVFSARKSDFQETGLVNLAQKTVSFDEIKQHIKPKTILILGIDAQAIGFDNLAYNTPLTRDGIQILYTYKMQDMLSDESRKKLFWEGFKRLL